MFNLLASSVYIQNKYILNLFPPISSTVPSYLDSVIISLLTGFPILYFCPLSKPFFYLSAKMVFKNPNWIMSVSCLLPVSSHCFSGGQRGPLWPRLPLTWPPPCSLSYSLLDPSHFSAPQALFYLRTFILRSFLCWEHFASQICVRLVSVCHSGSV